MQTEAQKKAKLKWRLAPMSAQIYSLYGQRKTLLRKINTQEQINNLFANK